MEHGENLTSLFFGHLFAKVDLEVNRIFSGKHFPDQFTQTWRSHLTCGNTQSRLYKSVIQACRNNVSLVVCSSQVTMFLLISY